jgi:hypothetical protein
MPPSGLGLSLPTIAVPLSAINPNPTAEITVAFEISLEKPLLIIFLDSVDI